jgi:hypothetical protein
MLFLDVPQCFLVYMPRIPLDISDELDLDLRAFCEVFFAANRSEVIRRAIVAFIAHSLDETGKRADFVAARQREGGEPLRLVTAEEEPDATSVDVRGQ